MLLGPNHNAVSLHSFSVEKGISMSLPTWEDDQCKEALRPGWGCGPVVEHLPCNCEALGLMPRAQSCIQTKTNKKIKGDLGYPLIYCSPSIHLGQSGFIKTLQGWGDPGIRSLQYFWANKQKGVETLKVSSEPCPVHLSATSATSPQLEGGCLSVHSESIQAMF